MAKKIALGLNIDHIATLREARKINYPDPLEAVFIAKNCGVEQITLHLREDRRHIQDDDVERVVASSNIPVNVECSCDEQIVDILCELKPYKVTLVPEHREELTTEGGLNMRSKKIKEIIEEFNARKIYIATFIDPELEAIELSKQYGASGIELHTGNYSNIYQALYSNIERTHNAINYLTLTHEELHEKLQDSIHSLSSCAKIANELGLGVFAGHGLNYQNVRNVVENVPYLSELNIGHSIISRAVIVGLERAIIDMQSLLYV